MPRRRSGSGSSGRSEARPPRGRAAVTLVLDASAVIDLLVLSHVGEQVRSHLMGPEGDNLLTAAHLDAEVFSGLARLYRAGVLSLQDVTIRLDRLAQLRMTRLPTTGRLLQTAWALRDNVSARDALYVAVARSLAAPLLTTDLRLARAVPDDVVHLGSGEE